MDDFKYVGLNGSVFSLTKLLSSEVLAFDVESSGLSMGKDYPIGFSLAYTPTDALFSNINDTLFRPILADESRLKIAHNAKFDRSMFRKSGLIVNNLCDTMIAAHLLGNYAIRLMTKEEKEEHLMIEGVPPSISLDNVVYTFLGKKFHDSLDVRLFESLPGKITEMTLSELTEYSAPHSACLLALWPVLEDCLKKLDLLHVFWDVEMPLVPVLSDMEYGGVAIDMDTLKRLGEYFDSEIAILIEALDHYSGHTNMNYNSPAQISDLFYGELKITPDWHLRSDGKPSVRGKRLAEIKGEHPILPVYLKFKELTTLKNTFVNGLLSRIYNGRVYGNFNQTRTGTGRLSSSDPNLQNIPQRTELGRRIRTAFVAPEGKSLVKADYDQLELRMMSHCSQDKNLIAAFRAGRDIHTETAVLVFGDADKRPDGKTLNFQLIYGGGSLSRRDMFFNAYPGVKSWVNSMNNQMEGAMYAKTINGRIREIKEFIDAARFSKYTYVRDDRMLSRGHREGISTIVQGSSAEVVKIGMRKAWDVLRHDSDIKFPLQVHDEFVVEVPDKMVPEVIDVLRKEMSYDELLVPITVSISTGKNWGEMKEIEKGNSHGN